MPSFEVHQIPWLPAAAALAMLLSISLPVQAQSTSAGTVFSANAQVDNNEAYSLTAGLDHAFTEATWLRLMAARVETADESGGGSTTRAAVGLDHYFDPAGLAFDVEYWGDSDAIETLALSGEVYYRGANARFALTAAYRDIELKFEVPDALRNLVAADQTVAATSLGVRYRYSWQAVSAYASASAWDYDEALGEIASNVDLSRVPPALRPAIQQRLTRVIDAVRFQSTSTLTLANSLLARSASVGIDYAFGRQSLNLEVGHDRGEIDDIDVNSLSAGWLFPASDAVDIEIRAGVSDSDEYGSGAFGGISMYVYR